MNFSRLNKKELTKEILEIDSIIGISFCVVHNQP